MVSSAGPLSDPLFEASPVAIADGEREFVRLALEAWNSGQHDAEREARRAWYHSNLEPRQLDRALLQIVSP